MYVQVCIGLYRCVYRCMLGLTDPAVAGEQDGVTLDVSVDHALRVQVGQRPQDRQTHRGNLLLVHPAERITTEL